MDTILGPILGEPRPSIYCCIWLNGHQLTTQHLLDFTDDPTLQLLSGLLSFGADRSEYVAVLQRSKRCIVD